MRPIYQNDQYYIKVRPKLNNQIVGEECDEMIVKLGDVVKKKSTNELIYDNANSCWLFPLNIDQSSELNFDVKIQAWFSFGNDYFSTPVKRIEVNCSIITKEETTNA